MKRWIAIFAAVWLCMIGCLAAGALDAGTYDAPIVSLTTKAPIPAIKAAFSKAFGETAQVEVLPDGSEVMTLENRHMSIKVFGRTYEANVVTMDGAQVLGTKQEKFSNPVNGLLSDPVVELETVPAAFRVPVRLDESGAQVLTITVDFMDEFMGKGEPHPTDVTLTLDTAAFRLQANASTTLPEDTTVLEENNSTLETTASTHTEWTEAVPTQTADEAQTTADLRTAAVTETTAYTPHTRRTFAIAAAVVLIVCLAVFWTVYARRKRRQK